MKKTNISKVIVKKQKKLKSKRGSELVETIVITTISLVLLVSIFYPALVTQFSGAVANLQTWFGTAFGSIGMI